MDKEILYNQSGIKDETAYKAIMRTGRGNENMNGYEINKGEIWEVESGAGTKLVVVLNCYDKYAATVMLQEYEPGSNAVSVRARDIMYADAGRLGYVFYDKMVDYVRTLSEEEDRELRQAIGAALDLEVNKVSSVTTAVALEARDKARDTAQQYENQVAELTFRLEAARAEADVLRSNMGDELEAKAARVDELEEQLRKAKDYSVDYKLAERRLHEDLAAASREAEIYKELYEQLLARALG